MMRTLTLALSATLVLGCSSDSNTSRSEQPARGATNDDQDAKDSACAGRPGRVQGKSNQMVDVAGTKRSFVYYVPSNLDPEQPAPLVIAAHGFAMTGAIMDTTSGFSELADREGFVVAYPEGANFLSPWNVGKNISGVGSTISGTADDQAFLDQIIAFVDEDRCLDRQHVFVSGFSMGGYFSSEVGCLRDDIAGIAPHSGGTHDLSDCPGSIKPVILFHGELDGVVVYAENAPLTRDRWLARNGCDSDFDAVTVKGGTCEYYKGCPEHAQVAFCHFPNIAHNWSGGPPGLYGNPDGESASELAWKFWREYAW